MSGTCDVDVVIPTRNRPVELATTLAGLAAQRYQRFRVLVSDQSDDEPSYATPSSWSLASVLRLNGHDTRFIRHLPRRGLAEHRAFLLDRTTARYVLFLDDDVWLEPVALDRMRTAIGRHGCGFVGAAVQGLSYVDDVRPQQLAHYEEWVGRVEPERITRDSPARQRASLNSAANPYHLERRLGLRPGEWRAYKVCWVGGCVLYDREALVDSGGFDFWLHQPGQPGRRGENDPTVPKRPTQAAQSRYRDQEVTEPERTQHENVPTISRCHLPLRRSPRRWCRVRRRSAAA